MSELLGASDKPFYIYLATRFKKGDIIQTHRYVRVIIIKYIKDTWWRRLFKWMGYEMYIGAHKVKVTDQ